LRLLEYVFDYLLSWWGISVLAASSFGFGLKTYDVFAKIWPATTGKHVTKGRITWSEFVSPELVLLKQAFGRRTNTGLISYSYSVNGCQHNGTIPTEKLNETEVNKRLYKGAEVDVYFSPKLPQHSFARATPSPSRMGGEITAKWFLFPVSALNALSFYIWFLATA
jgi:hypothetical protein